MLVRLLILLVLFFQSLHVLVERSQLDVKLPAPDTLLLPFSLQFFVRAFKGLVLRFKPLQLLPQLRNLHTRRNTPRRARADLVGIERMGVQRASVGLDLVEEFGSPIFARALSYVPAVLAAAECLPR